MATLSFHIFIMGKVEIGIYFCVTADILTKVLLKCFWSSLLPTIWILSYCLHSCTFRWALWPMGRWFSTFLFWKQLRQIVGRTSVSLVTLTCGSWSEGQHDPYFMVQWFCLISWKLFDVWTSYFEIMSQYDPTCDLKINVGYWDLYFMVQWFCLISWRLFILRDYESVWPNVSPKKL